MSCVKTLKNPALMRFPHISGFFFLRKLAWLQLQSYILLSVRDPQIMWSICFTFVSLVPLLGELFPWLWMRIKIFKYCNTSVFHLMFISTYHLSLKKLALYRKTCLNWYMCNPPLCVKRHFWPFPMCFTLCNSKSCNFLSHNM